MLGIAALALPGSISTQPKVVDVETRGELTSGMIIVDERRGSSAMPNCSFGMGAAIGEIRQWIERVLMSAP